MSSDEEDGRVVCISECMLIASSGRIRPRHPRRRSRGDRRIGRDGVGWRRMQCQACAGCPFRRGGPSPDEGHHDAARGGRAARAARVLGCRRGGGGSGGGGGGRGGQGELHGRTARSPCMQVLTTAPCPSGELHGRTARPARTAPRLTSRTGTSLVPAHFRTC